MCFIGQNVVCLSEYSIWIWETCVVEWRILYISSISSWMMVLSLSLVVIRQGNPLFLWDWGSSGREYFVTYIASIDMESIIHFLVASYETELCKFIFLPFPPPTVKQCGNLRLLILFSISNYIPHYKFERPKVGNNWDRFLSVLRY